VSAKQRLGEGLPSNRPTLEEARRQLSRLTAAQGKSLRELWLALARLTSAALDVERVGVWVLIENSQAIRCRYLWQRSGNQFFQGTVLRISDFPSYFAALEHEGVIRAADARNSPMTRELRPAYLEPLGITSMLDAPIYLDGKLAGVVCHEHIGPARTWDDAECDFAAAVADNIARLYREHEQYDAQATLQGYQRRLMELHHMEAVGRMAAGIAHDFRGIIGAALGFAELISRTPNDPNRVKHYADRIREALERGQRLTRDVMDFGKNDSFAPRLLDVAEVIESNAKMLRILLGEHITVETQLSPTLGRVLMDSAQLERALLNLVLNARDAMPSGGRVVISASDADVVGTYGEECTCVMIAVSDTGHGMDEHTRANALKPFFSTKGEQGTGLGLAIVEQVISRAGGFVRIESTPNEGTTVRLYVPRIAANC
jgi:signal transduction histidine kinase